MTHTNIPHPGWTQTPQFPGRYWLQWADAPRREPLLVHVYQSDGFWGYEFESGEFVYLVNDRDAWLYGPVVAPTFV